MDAQTHHHWNVSPETAQRIQKRLVSRVAHRWDGDLVRTVAGLDVGFSDGKARAAAAVLSYPELQFVEGAVAVMDIHFPYVPGLLAFREGPAILSAVGRLETRPDLLMFDGHGWAHPRRMGIATHIGVLLDTPSIGCAKSRLVGTYHEPEPQRGAYARLCVGHETIGAALRTRDGVRPLFVSVGHRMDLETAMSFVLRCSTRYRLPEPIRAAHQLASGGSSRQSQRVSRV